MKIDVKVTTQDSPAGVITKDPQEVSADVESGQLLVRVNAVEINTEKGLFDVLSSAFDFPDYFGRNWDALNECFSDYFVLERGGLGSEFGGRIGLDARVVKMLILNADGLLAHGDQLLGGLVSLLRYTREVNQDRRSADLYVVFELCRRSGASQISSRFERLVAELLASE